ncbi:MAG: helix-turn-helix transcriptional regulator [Deltaproteobacteria bacterium]|nr:helix-turn-helix transcriptional regulator [Deltaproteobacteria bacterium]
MNMKKEPEKTLMDEYLEDPEFAKLVAQGDLIMEVTETLCEILEEEKVSRKELADRLGKTKGFISQLLNGGRNLTLRTVADILHVLGYKVSLTPYKEVSKKQESNVIEFRTRQTLPKKKPTQIWRTFELSHADSYRKRAAIFG